MNSKKNVDAAEKLLNSTLSSIGETDLVESNRSDSRTQNIKIKPESLKKIAGSLKSNGFDYLSFITAVDYRSRIEMVYRFTSIQPGADFVVKCDLSSENPSIDSLCELYKTADWNEREAYDMFGVKFNGHNDLRRILTCDDFPGHPLLKKFVVVDEPDQYGDDAQKS